MTTSNRTILTVGASGPTAGLVVPELAHRGVRVRAFIRDRNKEQTVRSNGASEIALGDLNDSASLDAALQGVDGAFYIGPAFMPDGAEAGRRFVDAARRAGVRRIVFSGVIHPTLSDLENHAVTVPIEAAILDSGLEYVFLHPAIFFQNITSVWQRVVQTGVFAEPWSAQTRFSRVDYRDVAEVAAIALTEDRLNYGTFELCSDGWLDRAEVAAMMSDVLDRTIEASTVDAKNMPAPEPLHRMFSWYDQHELRGNALTLRAILGREPRSLRAFLEELAR